MLCANDFPLSLSNARASRTSHLAIVSLYQPPMPLENVIQTHPMLSKYTSYLLDVLALNLHAIIIMHAASVALLVWPFPT